MPVKFLDLARAAAAIGFCMASATALAELRLMDTASFGSNTATWDSQSGLSWLNLSFTAGLSFSNVSDQMRASGRLEGWRYATREEWNDLYGQFGFDVTANKYVANPHFFHPDLIAAMEISSLYLGNLSRSSDSRDVFQGGLITLDEANGLAPYLYYAFDACLSGINNVCDARPEVVHSTFGQYYGDGRQPMLAVEMPSPGGSYLVRVAEVPETPTSLLFGLGVWILWRLRGRHRPAWADRP